MTLDDPLTRPTLVVGASRGLGRGVATVLADSRVPVIAVARDQTALAELAAIIPAVRTAAADATDPSAAGRLIDRYAPRNLVLVAGASPLVRPLHRQTWETFSANWDTDVKMAFHWLREALLRPLESGGASS